MKNKKTKKLSQTSSLMRGRRVERMIDWSDITNKAEKNKAKMNLANTRIYKTFKTFFFCSNLFAK